MLMDFSSGLNSDVSREHGGIPHLGFTMSLNGAPVSLLYTWGVSIHEKRCVLWMDGYRLYRRARSASDRSWHDTSLWRNLAWFGAQLYTFPRHYWRRFPEHGSCSKRDSQETSWRVLNAPQTIPP